MPFALFFQFNRWTTFNSNDRIWREIFKWNSSVQFLSFKQIIALLCITQPEEPSFANCGNTFIFVLHYWLPAPPGEMLVSSGSDLLALTQTSHLFNGWREGAAALNLLLNLLGSSLWNVGMKRMWKHKTQNYCKWPVQRMEGGSCGPWPAAQSLRVKSIH